MKRLKSSLFVFSAMLSLASVAQGTNVQGANADEIVSSYINAIGGKEKISQIKSVYMEASMNVMGNDAPMTTTILNGKGFRNDVDFNGQKIITAVSETGGWMINPMMGSSDAQKMPDEQYNAARSQMYVGGELMNYAADGGKLSSQGTEKVGNVDAQKVVLTGANNNTITYYFDPSTHYLVKMERTMSMGGQEGTVSAVYSDYRKTDSGFVVPYSIETTLPQGFSMTANVKKVEVNKDVDPKIFEMPK